MRWRYVPLAVIAVAVTLAYVPGRTAIPPLVESDYCYLLTAADRFSDGHGLTATQPVAPLQPWEWRYDWGFLTQWPVGFPLLVAGVRFVSGLPAIEACRWISLVACAVAVVGWFLCIRRSVPPGVTGMLIAAAGAGLAVPAAFLVNPSTDALLVAALPIAVLLTLDGIATGPANHAGNTGGTSWETRLTAAGFLSGALFWFRYASVFVPVAIAAYLMFRYLRRTGSLRELAAYTVTAAAPILLLLAVNRAYAPGGSVQTQFNLGTAVGIDWSFTRVIEAWWNFTDLGFYNYRPVSHWVTALWPLGLMLVVFIGWLRGWSAVRRLAGPPIGLSLFLLAALLAMLVTATTLFHGKYDYVADLRYYLPVKPLYCVLFLGPFLPLAQRRLPRIAVCAVLLLACSWIVQVEWQRPYERWMKMDRLETPYGRWSRTFEPGAAQLYAWLRENASTDLVVISNFHEYIALETGVPALPVPGSRAELTSWLERICAVRGVADPNVLFVLDPDNRWRSYWIEEPEEVIGRFNLEPSATAPADARRYVYEWDGHDALDVEFVELQPIGLRVQRRHGLGPGAM